MSGKYVAQRAGIGINAGGSEESTPKSEEVKSSIQVLYLFSKSLSQLSDVALKTASEGRQLSTFLLAPRNQRHPRPQKQQRNRRQPSQKTRLQHPVK